MRIRILHRSLCEVGGAEILVVEQARLLARLGADVRIRTFVYDESRWALRTHPVPVDARASCSAGTRRPNIPGSLEDRRIEWLLADLAEVDLAIAHNFPASSALGRVSSPKMRVWYCHEPPRDLYPEDVSPYLRANAQRAPLRHGPQHYEHRRKSWTSALPFVGRRRPGHLAADKKGIRALDAVWANSEFTRDCVQRIYGPVETAVVYPMVDVPEALPARVGLPREGLRIMTLTRLEWIKNLDTLLDGFALFRKRTDRRAELHIVGKGPVRAALEQQAERLGLAGAVFFRGFLDTPELEALFARSDAFACLPFDEPFGMVFPEAMARGLLVLGPDHGGPLEILDQGRLGELADPLNPEAIADGLARIGGLSDTEADRRRALASSTVKQRFSSSALSERLTALLSRRGLRFAD